MNQFLTILLLEVLSDDQLQRLSALSPGIRLLKSADIAAHPELLAEVHVIYGHLEDPDWPRARALRWVQIPWVGADYMLTPAFRALNVPVYKSAGVNARCMVESMFGMLLMFTRRFAEMWEAQARQEWVMDAIEPRQQSLEGKTLGLLGLGQIGSHAADVGRAFRMHVIGCRLSGEPHKKADEVFGPDARGEFCRRSDVIMSTLPLTDATRGFIGAEEFAAMKRGTILLNFGRSRTVDKAAMLGALRSGHLGAAILDVFDTEPLPKGDELWTTPNVFISPHCSGHYPGRWDRSGELFLENVAREVKGEPLRNPVDLAKGY